MAIRGGCCVLLLSSDVGAIFCSVNFVKPSTDTTTNRRDGERATRVANSPGEDDRQIQKRARNTLSRMPRAERARLKIRAPHSAHESHFLSTLIYNGLPYARETTK
jgi:hypothetical protein